MNDLKYVSVYDSQTEKYHQAFKIFLEHTDQKINAKKKLDELVASLQQRRVLIDAGAGNGHVTCWYESKFNRTIAIEPNPLLARDLLRKCPSCEVLPQTILQAQPKELGDLVLCSHVLYYVERKEWLINLQKLVSWLSDRGLLVVILQSYENDCMKMVTHFSGECYSSSRLQKQFLSLTGNEYQAASEPVEAYVTVKDLDRAYTIAEFVLNSISISNPPPLRRDLEQYIETKFRQSDGSYRYSCHQDFLLIKVKSDKK